MITRGIRICWKCHNDCLYRKRKGNLDLSRGTSCDNLLLVLPVAVANASWYFSQFVLLRTVGWPKMSSYWSVWGKLSCGNNGNRHQLDFDFSFLEYKTLLGKKASLLATSGVAWMLSRFFQLLFLGKRFYWHFWLLIGLTPRAFLPNWQFFDFLGTEIKKIVQFRLLGIFCTITDSIFLAEVKVVMVLDDWVSLALVD